MTIVLALEGVIALLAHEAWGNLLVAASAAVLVASAIVEPATTRAAFEEKTVTGTTGATGATGPRSSSVIFSSTRKDDDGGRTKNS